MREILFPWNVSGSLMKVEISLWLNRLALMDRQRLGNLKRIFHLILRHLPHWKALKLKQG